MQFCPHCGVKLFPDARFCQDCGRPLIEREGATSRSSRGPAQPRRHDLAGSAWGPFAAMFTALMVFGVAVAYLINRQLPAREALVASASTATAGDDNSTAPADHPPLKLSKEVLDFIKNTEANAHSHPDDLVAWDRMGDVTLRAAAFDPSYYTSATEAYSHVLKANPDDLDALRGIGNVDFDERKFDAAIAAYEHYLAQKPEDADVRTDLGTMLLSSGATDEAIRQYKSVLDSHPTFFEAAFNLGVAYENSSPAEARAAFERAAKVAPNQRARERVKQEVAALDSATGTAADAATDTNASAPPAAPPTNFRGALEQVMHDLPIAGNKVQAVQWESDKKARVLMNDFPMDQMPPFATAKFLADLKAGVDRAKGTYKVVAPVEIDLCDAASGRVMQSVTE
jgi:tetratricopeptide (TPR) repeat protein